MENVSDLMILGSPVSQSRKLSEGLQLHCSKRFSCCIKYFNFIRSNKLAPNSVKLKVLEACVISTLLYNCETFGQHVQTTRYNIYENE